MSNNRRYGHRRPERPVLRRPVVRQTMSISALFLPARSVGFNNRANAKHDCMRFVHFFQGAHF